MKKRSSQNKILNLNYYILQSAKSVKMRKLSMYSSKVVLSKILTLAIILTPNLNIIRLSGLTTQTQDDDTGFFESFFQRRLDLT